MNEAIFISYRRSLSRSSARSIYTDLTKRFGDKGIFLDIDRIKSGKKFDEALDAALQNSKVLLVLMDRGWSEVTSPDGALRLEDPEDFVRKEISGALANDCVVVPILLDDAEMPIASELPPSISELA